MIASSATFLRRRAAVNGSAARQVRFRGLERERPHVEVVAIREDHDREAVVRKPLDHRAEPGRLTVVPHPRVAKPGIQQPAEAVRHRLPGVQVVAARRSRRPVRRRAVGERDRRERRLHPGRGEQLVHTKGLVPLREVLEVRVDTPVAEGRRGRALVGLPEARAVLRVAERSALDLVASLLVRQRVVHLERREDALAQEVAERLPRDAGHDEAEHDVA
jgi:hypothetical protein